MILRAVRPPLLRKQRIILYRLEYRGISVIYYNEIVSSRALLKYSYLVKTVQIYLRLVKHFYKKEKSVDAGKRKKNGAFSRKTSKKTENDAVVLSTN